MEFGLFLVTQFDLAHDLQNVGDELIAQTRLADESGFGLVGIGEHHFTDSHQYLLNEACLAHIAQYVGEMRLVASIILLPYHNPARIAELGSTLDILSGGQFTMGVGLGYRQREYDVFGISKADAIGRFTEGIEIIKRLWTHDTISYHGDHFQLDEVAIRPQPLQSPRPEIWTGASNEPSIRRGARQTDAFLGAHVPFDLARRQIEIFRDERERSGLDRGAVGLLREAFVAETREECEAIVKEPLLRKYESYREWGQDDVIGGDDFDSPWEQLRHERFLVGTPKEVRDIIDRYLEAMDLDYLFVRTQFPGLSPNEVRSSITLLGEEVIPHYQ